jgi:fatty-acyl-CoA synthase/long-chain acyl-CoA synthetase
MGGRDVLTRIAASDPDKPAVIDGDVVLGYGEFDRLVNRCANALIDLGVRAGDKVLWVGQNGWEVAAIVHAIRKAGGVCVPMNYRLTAEESAYVVGNCDAVAVLFDDEQAAQLEDARRSCANVARWIRFRAGDAAGRWGESFERLLDQSREDEPVPVGESFDAGTTMIYTSGTTGFPKGVRRGQNAAAQAELLDVLGFVGDDVYITTGPLYHSGPLAFMMRVQTLGGTAVLQRRFDPEDWLRLVDAHRVTSTFAAPTPIRRVVDLPEDVRRRYDAGSLRRVIGNAAPWPFALKKRYVEAFGNTSLFEVYGSTELSVNTILRPEDQLRKPASCGRPAPNNEIRLYDEDGSEVTEPYQPGELYVRSPLMFVEYYKDAEKFARSRRGEFLSVGDIAYRDEEGYYYICDRKTDMIISGGVNIYPAEIEAVLVAHPAVMDAAVFGIPSEEWGESVHAVITLFNGAVVTDDELSAFARQHLAGYKVPRSYSRMSEIPRSASGKVLKRELRAPYWAG